MKEHAGIDSGRRGLHGPTLTIPPRKTELQHVLSLFSEASVQPRRSGSTTSLMWEAPITPRSCCQPTVRFAPSRAQAPAAAWYERELHDQYGIEIIGHPDLRPLIFHENWPDGVYPMVDAVDNVPWSKRDYRFLQVQGEGIAEVAVGPVHAGIIEPGHFRFSVVGDTILHLELRHFYTHKGTEKLFEGRSATDGVMLAESVSGDNCFAHAVCYSQAVENACGIDVPPRALAIRLIGLEFERLVCHISDIGGLCTDVGFGVAAAYATRLKESLLRAVSAVLRNALLARNRGSGRPAIRSGLRSVVRAWSGCLARSLAISRSSRG